MFIWRYCESLWTHINIDRKFRLYQSLRHTVFVFEKYPITSCSLTFLSDRYDRMSTLGHVVEASISTDGRELCGAPIRVDVCNTSWICRDDMYTILILTECFWYMLTGKAWARNDHSCLTLKTGAMLSFFKPGIFVEEQVASHNTFFFYLNWPLIAQVVKIISLALPTLAFFENGSLGGGVKMTLPLISSIMRLTLPHMGGYKVPPQ